jgi:hypothetical protein
MLNRPRAIFSEGVTTTVLTNTFIHIQGIGVKTEQTLWSSGLTEWNSISSPAAPEVPARLRWRLSTGIEESIEHLNENDPAYFSKRLPGNQCWRLFQEFRSSIAYVDIETTGLDRDYNEITTIALYDGHSIRTYVQGDNLQKFVEDIQAYRTMVTYNGRSFDAPFIERFFNFKLNHAHIDLRYILFSLGFRGGLKGCETQLGIHRGDLEGVDGFLAVHLWDLFKRKRDEKALETLLAYNVQDTINLESVMVTAYNMKIGTTPFAKDRLMQEVVPLANPFKADVSLVEEIKRTVGVGYGGWYS